MIQSMTAFTRYQHQAEWGEVVFELRSLNHRFLDLHLRLPERLQLLEPDLRIALKQKLKRGKVDCSLQNLNLNKNQLLTINHQLVAQLQQQLTSLSQNLNHETTIELTRLLQWPGVLENDTSLVAGIQADLLTGFVKAVDELVHARQREGAELANVMLSKLAEMQSIVEAIKQQLPVLQQQLREKLQQQFEKARLELEAERFESELIYYLQKQDVAEELDRLDLHVQEIKRLIQKGGAIGRRLDFFMQELNREANTLSSKSTNVTVTQYAVDLKVLIEQIREQVQNVE